MSEFILTNDLRGAPRRSDFADNERTKQTLLLSGLKTCLPGQLDLFDVDSFPKETFREQTHPDRSRD